VSRYTYNPPTTKDYHVGRKVKTYMCFTTLKTKTEIGEKISYNDQNKDWEVKYQDGNIIDIDAHTLEYSLLDHNNESNDQGYTRCSVLSEQSQTARYTERDTSTTKPLRERLDHESYRHRITGLQRP
jgi:hypothetical protein